MESAQYAKVENQEFKEFQTVLYRKNVQEKKIHEQYTETPLYKNRKKKKCFRLPPNEATGGGAFRALVDLLRREDLREN